MTQTEQTAKYRIHVNNSVGCELYASKLVSGGQSLRDELHRTIDEVMIFEENDKIIIERRW